MLAALMNFVGGVSVPVGTFVDSASASTMAFAGAVQTFFAPLTAAAQTFIVG